MSTISADYTLDALVTGAARGADNLGYRWAIENGIKVFYRYLPEWSKYGKAAGPIRNAEMASNADICIVFWDGSSKGTLSMINEAKKRKLILYIINYLEIKNGQHTITFA